MKHLDKATDYNVICYKVFRFIKSECFTNRELQAFFFA